MKRDYIINKIKKEALSRIIYGIFLELIAGTTIIINIWFLSFLISKLGEESLYWLALIFFIFFTLIIIVFFKSVFKKTIKSIKEYKEPLDNHIFKRYGPPEKINEIIKELENDPIYSNSKIIINNKFIYIKKELNSLCALEDIIGVYKQFEKLRRYQIPKLRIYYHDKFGKSYHVGYSYLFNSPKFTDKIIKILIPRCKNAKFGNKKETFDYIDNYKIEEEPEYYNNRVIKEIKVKKELVNEDNE